MITIGQLAAYAGVTIKAVRHYHKRGLLEEPSRDSSGYRRYSAKHAVELIKIKTLADAGVPLAPHQGVARRRPRPLRHRIGRDRQRSRKTSRGTRPYPRA